jgi:hypothetical protein
MEIKQHKLIGLQIVVFDDFERIKMFQEFASKCGFANFLCLCIF